MVVNEAKKWDVQISPQLAEYWATKTAKIAKANKLPASLLISIISQETHGNFQKNINSENGAGPMGITTIAIEAFLPKTKNGKPNEWAKIYKNMHPELVNDIMKHSHSATVLRSKAGKNDELGIQMGLLAYEMQYCRQVAIKLYGKATYETIPKAIEKIKNGYRLKEESDEKYLKNAFRDYNASKNKVPYSIATMDSLKRLTHGSFENLIFIEKEK